MKEATLIALGSVLGFASSLLSIRIQSRYETLRARRREQRERLEALMETMSALLSATYGMFDAFLEGIPDRTPETLPPPTETVRKASQAVFRSHPEQQNSEFSGRVRRMAEFLDDEDLRKRVISWAYTVRYVTDTDNYFGAYDSLNQADETYGQLIRELGELARSHNA